jgi:hypothetical protein
MIAGGTKSPATVPDSGSERASETPERSGALGPHERRR